MKKNIGDKAFLIGNGINRAISNGVKSWEDLLGNLSKSFSVDVDLTNEFKPFPLSFEEILFRTNGNFDENLKRIKSKIAKSFQDTPNTRLHEIIVNSGIKHILTTNYDYAFEKVIIPAFNNEIGQLPVSTRETINSIRRRSIFKDKPLSVWHIHGEINDNKNFTSKDNYPSKSIMIGYEHYSEYIGEMQKYIRGEKMKEEKRLSEKLQEKEFEQTSWIDLFFTTDLVIAGLSFDFSEQHLWWLLNYRAKQKRRERKNIKNSIKYYYAVLPEVDPNDLNEFAKRQTKRKITKAKLELFSSLGVDAIPIECNNYEEYFLKTFDKEI
jgi:hypothetical protein